MIDFFELREELSEATAKSLSKQIDKLMDKYQKLFDAGKTKEADKVWKQMNKLQSQKNDLTREPEDEPNDPRADVDAKILKAKRKLPVNAKKVIDALEKTLEGGDYPSNSGMRPFVLKVLKKAGIKKPADLIDFSRGQFPASNTLRDNVKWRKKVSGDMSYAVMSVNKDGFAEFLASIFAIYDEGDFKSFKVFGADI